jgi:hypothetical protein
MATKAERLKALQDQIEALESEDDEETVVWVRKGDHETRLTGQRAKRWLRANGYDEDDADDSTKSEPLEEKPAKSAAPAKKITPGQGPRPRSPRTPPMRSWSPTSPPPRRVPREFF